MGFNFNFRNTFLPILSQFSNMVKTIMMGVKINNVSLPIVLLVLFVFGLLLYKILHIHGASGNDLLNNIGSNKEKKSSRTYQGRSRYE